MFSPDSVSDMCTFNISNNLQITTVQRMQWWRHYNVKMTSLRRFDIKMMLLLLRVFVGCWRDTTNQSNNDIIITLKWRRGVVLTL